MLDFFFREKIKLVNFRQEEPTLEDAFIELTGDRCEPMRLTQELDKIYYFMKRDIISFSTYKTNILLSVVSALFGALSYAFWGANASMPSVQNLGMPVVTYLLIGLAFNTYLSQSLTLVQRTINPWSLEEVLVSPTGLVTFIVGSSLWGFIWSTLVIVIYLSVGVFAFGVILSVNIIGTIIVVGTGYWNIHRV